MFKNIYQLKMLFLGIKIEEKSCFYETKIAHSTKIKINLSCDYKYKNIQNILTNRIQWFIIKGKHHGYLFQKMEEWLNVIH